MQSWGLDLVLDANKYQSFARCYRNKKGAGFIAEIYSGQNEYKECFWDDSLHAISFFGTGNITQHKIGEMADVHLIFFVNIEKLKPLLTNRADEEIRLDVLNVLGKGWYGFNLVSTETGIENVLREYPGTIRDKGLTKVDIHPVHCFRINLKLNYNKKVCF